MNITNNELAVLTENTEGMYKKMKRERPTQYEIMKLGGFCKKYNLDIEDLKTIKSLKNKIEENINNKTSN